MDIIWKATIQGQPTSKSNSQWVKIVHRGPKSYGQIIKSTAAKKYMLQFEDEIRVKKLKPKTPIEVDVKLTVWFFYESRRPDLDDSQLSDCLQYCEIIKNDRQIKEKHLYHGLSKTNPRAVIILQPLT